MTQSALSVSTLYSTIWKENNFVHDNCWLIKFPVEWLIKSFFDAICTMNILTLDVLRCDSWFLVERLHNYVSGQFASRL